MGKWHISSDGKVRPCHAKVQCRLGGVHFDSQTEAEDYVNKKYQDEFGTLGSDKPSAKKVYDKSGRGVKALLKDNNIDTKNISVSLQKYSGGESYRVNLKDLNLNKKEIEDLVSKEFSSIRYDEYTGEILQGANTFVFVDYDHETYYNARKEYKEKASVIWDNAPDKQTKIYSNDEYEVILDKEQGAIFANRKFTIDEFAAGDTIYDKSELPKADGMYLIKDNSKYYVADVQGRAREFFFLSGDKNEKFVTPGSKANLYALRKGLRTSEAVRLWDSRTGKNEQVMKELLGESLLDLDIGDF